MTACSQDAIRSHGRFQKGHSGNPGGRPVRHVADGRSLTEIARLHTDDAIQALVAVVEDRRSPPAARVAAANSLLDRGWGRPAQMIVNVEHELSSTPSSPMEAAARIASILDTAGIRRREHVLATQKREESD